MSFGNISYIGPGVETGDERFVVLGVLVEDIEPFKC